MAMASPPPSPEIDSASQRLIQQLLQENQSVALALQLQQEEDERVAQRLLRDEETVGYRKLQHEEDDDEDAKKPPPIPFRHKNAQYHRNHDSDQDDQVDMESKSLALALQLQQEEDAIDTTKLALLDKQQVLQMLDEQTERRAYLQVQARARELHQQALPALRERVRELGMDEMALQYCLDYIRDDAPICIHFKPETLPVLNRDSHYRSLFETGVSGGCRSTERRKKWETLLFDGAYDFALPEQRPKYGCLNISGDIRGVRAARAYGSCAITLASTVRYRSTFSDRDTGNHIRELSGLATHDYYAHILLQYPDNDLKAILNVSRLGGAPSRCQQYKEVQIHGPICLATDVQTLSVPGRLEDASVQFLKCVTDFQKKTGCNILWQHDLLGL